MDNSILFLAFSTGLIHTLLGADHYLPFIALSKSNNWSFKKTFFITLICGIAHVLSSVIIGLIGLWFGINIFKLNTIESYRGEIASWFLISFGLAYLIWALKNFIKGKYNSIEYKNLFWILFVIFIFGPCEPLIPILMFPALEKNMMLSLLVVTIFSVTTLLTMLSLVLSTSFCLNFIPLKRFKYTHVVVGIVIFFCGLAIKLLGA